MVQKPQSEPEPLKWDWDIEHEDRKIEAQADASMHNTQPFQVDRRVLKDVVWEKMGAPVGRIQFLSSGESASPISRCYHVQSMLTSTNQLGTFHKVCTARCYSYHTFDADFNSIGLCDYPHRPQGAGRACCTSIHAPTQNRIWNRYSAISPWQYPRPRAYSLSLWFQPL